MISLQELKANRDPERFAYFNKWVKEFFKREVLREANRLSEYSPSTEFGEAMRPEVSYWNPNRSKHAEVFWLENYVFSKDTSLRNKILNAIAVKFVGMPTLTLVASNTSDYNNIIDFDEYSKHAEYYKRINENLDNNKYKLKVWGRTQLQTSLQTAARNFCRIEDDNPSGLFKLSNMIRWVEHLDNLGLSETVKNKDNTLKDVCEWLIQHRGIGPYFGYHPPCNFSRCDDLPNIDEDQDFCLVGPGAKCGMEYVFPNIKFNEKLMQDYIVTIKNNQYEFFEFNNPEEKKYFSDNLENDGFLTTFGTEITFCQFNCFLCIKDNPKAQEKRMLPLTFDAFVEIAKEVDEKMNRFTLNDF